MSNKFDPFLPRTDLAKCTTATKAPFLLELMRLDLVHTSNTPKPLCWIAETTSRRLWTLLNPSLTDK